MQRLENQLCFVLYAYSRQLCSLFRPVLDRWGITYPQYFALLALWEGQELTVKQLGEKLYLDSGTLTPMLKRMEEAGWVKRQRSTVDERKVIVTLNEKAEALRSEMTNLPQMLLEQSGMTQQDAALLLEQLKRMMRQSRRTNQRS
ncbi:MarR family winged helix-turn-helix transcriptional regulator [Laceyella putida]|uniref:HTH-type transcriptional regulator SarZ n=1 Tax=Laceyella putida TaxID=110101 RepID=A0ABW2RLU0_9BACL